MGTAKLLSGAGVGVFTRGHTGVTHTDHQGPWMAPTPGLGCARQLASERLGAIALVTSKQAVGDLLQIC